MASFIDWLIRNRPSRATAYCGLWLGTRRRGCGEKKAHWSAGFECTPGAVTATAIIVASGQGSGSRCRLRATAARRCPRRHLPFATRVGKRLPRDHVPRASPQRSVDDIPSLRVRWALVPTELHQGVFCCSSNLLPLRVRANSFFGPQLGRGVSPRTSRRGVQPRRGHRASCQSYLNAPRSPISHRNTRPDRRRLSNRSSPPSHGTCRRPGP